MQNWSKKRGGGDLFRASRDKSFSAERRSVFARESERWDSGMTNCPITLSKSTVEMKALMQSLRGREKAIENHKWLVFAHKKRIVYRTCWGKIPPHQQKKKEKSKWDYSFTYQITASIFEWIITSFPYTTKKGASLSQRKIQVPKQVCESLSWDTLK